METKLKELIEKRKTLNEQIKQVRVDNRQIKQKKRDDRIKVRLEKARQRVKELETQ